MQRTEIESLGEFGLIRRLTEQTVLRQPSSLLGIGDDAAVINPEGKRVVVSTDMLVEGVHFDLSYAPLKHLGYKAVAVNLSDICAMNALPTQVTVSIAVSSRFSVEALDELYTGVHKACAVYGVDLVGGDTSSSASGLMISVAALGLVDGDQAVSRSGAKAGDLLVVTGDLGGAYMGLQILEREKAVFQSAPTAQPDLSGHEGILERQLKPEARTDVIRELKSYNIEVDEVDPFASPEEVKHEYDIDLKGEPDQGAYDAIILAVAHAPYKAMKEPDFAALMRHESGVFADLKGLYRGEINTLEYWSL